jgi:hypothetical protein
MESVGRFPLFGKEMPDDTYTIAPAACQFVITLSSARRYAVAAAGAGSATAGVRLAPRIWGPEVLCAKRTFP